MAIKCMICGGPADSGWETCSSCDIEQSELRQQEAEEETYEERFARDFDKRIYEEQDEIAYLDRELFGAH